MRARCALFSLILLLSSFVPLEAHKSVPSRTVGGQEVQSVVFPLLDTCWDNLKWQQCSGCVILVASGNIIKRGFDNSGNYSCAGVECPYAASCGSQF